jgi:cytoskeletal protein CcmA (bactofilin family)
MFFKRKLFSGKGSGQESQSEPTVVARNMTIEGNLMCDGELHIDGTIIGSVRAGICVVEATGSITGEVHAEALYVHGTINGPINAGHVRIYAGSQVKGDVANETISIEDGAYLHGSVRHGRSAPAPRRAPVTSGNPAANPFDASAPNSNQPGVTTEDFRPVKVVRPRG